MADSPSDTERRRAPGRPGRLELTLLTLRLNARAIGWGAGVLSITLALAAIGILQGVRDGEPVTRAGTIVGTPSSQSIHVRVRLENGEAVLVPRERRGKLADGDRVTVLETVSALSTVGYRLVDEPGRER